MPDKRIEETKKIISCPECGSDHIAQDYKRRELVCEDCGLVFNEDMIDQTPKWRTFESVEKKPSGKVILTKNKEQLYKLRKWQRRIRVSNATERNLAFALSELDRISSSLGLSRNIRETAAKIYRKALNKHLIIGHSIEGIVSASLYASCRICSTPRTLDEIAYASRLGRKEIGRNYLYIKRKLKLEITTPRPQAYASRFCNQLKLSGKVEKRVIEMLKEPNLEDRISGRNPIGIVAAAIYLAAIIEKEARTQREIANILGVTEVALRNNLKQLGTSIRAEWLVS